MPILYHIRYVCDTIYCMKSGSNKKDITVPDSPALMAFGKELRKRRKFWGISQAGLAKKGATTQATIARIEAGHGNPTIETLEGIAFALQQDLVVSFRVRQRR